MRLFELEHETHNEKLDKFVEFIEIMAKNTDKEITDFLFSNPLYRSTRSSSDWFPEFGINPIPKNRKPLSTPPIFQKMIDSYLSSKGFKALRSNSIFCTGSMSFAGFYSNKKSPLMVIFPQKNFYFTWNKISQDFYIDWEIYAHDIFEINFSALKKLEKSKKEFIVNIFNKTFFSLVEKTDMQKLQKEIANGNYDNVFEFYKNIVKESKTKLPHTYSNFIKILFNMINFLQEDIEKITIFNNKSKFLRSFDSKNFEEAVKSGNEIMIANSNYFYFENNFFLSNKNKIYNLLKKFQ